MHGFYLRAGRARRYDFDPRYLSQKRRANHFGHNNLQPGAWWPLQIVALYHGAHGNPFKGIYGNPTDGAFSVVISGASATYHDLDTDNGDTVWYSADAPHTTDPSAPSPDTKALQRSLLTRRPVRVLRSGGIRRHASSAWAPAVGIRYDGLYRVVDQVQGSNGRGGRVWKFKMVRVVGQRALEEIRDAVPSRAQRRDEARVREGY